MFFDGVRDNSLAQLTAPRPFGRWMKDRLAFPWLALASSDRAIAAGLTPLDLERFRVVLPWVRGRLLDIGCGDNLLVEAYGSGIGADIVDWGRVDVILSGDGSLPFDDGSFDTVTIVAALNHIAPRERLLAECRRVLSDDGRIIVTMLTPWVSRITHRVRHDIDPDQTHRHQEDGEVWGLTPRAMQSLLARAGFQLVRTEPFVWNLNRLYVAGVSTAAASD
jgi:SAM-dependent methyltransferase